MKNKVAVATYQGVEKLMLKWKFSPPPPSKSLQCFSFLSECLPLDFWHFFIDKKISWKPVQKKLFACVCICGKYDTYVKQTYGECMWNFHIYLGER